MELLIDSVKVIGRIVTILPFMLFIGLFMGKRSIGELPVFDLLVILVLGTVVGADIADPTINHIHTFVAVIALAVLQKGITYLKLKNRKIGRILTFEPTVVLYQGEFLTNNMKKINYSIDNILQMLREKDIFRLKDVEIAIVEASGKLSVSLKPAEQPVKGGDLNIPLKKPNFEIPLILDGVIQKSTLDKLNKDSEWVRDQLASNKVNTETDVFYAGINSDGDLNLTLKGSREKEPPPIFH